MIRSGLKCPLKGLYVITDSRLSGPGVVKQVSNALLGGAKLVQYRDKSTDDIKKLSEVRELLRICHFADVPLIINDDVDLALMSGADGVHLGKDDVSIQVARDRLGEQAIIGVSCYGEMETAQQAVLQGVDYVAFGRFFPSCTKPQAKIANSRVLNQAQKELSVPIVAIGGITRENGDSLIKAGADLLAVIHAVFGQSDVKAASAGIARLFKTQENYLL